VSKSSSELLEQVLNQGPRTYSPGPIASEPTSAVEHVELAISGLKRKEGEPEIILAKKSS